MDYQATHFTTSLLGGIVAALVLRRIYLAFSLPRATSLAFDLLPAGLSVQEVWDRILDELYDSPRDLKACALVCRSFTPRAQANLFRELVIHPDTIETPWALGGHGVPPPLSVFHELIASLEHSPRLISCVRSLYVLRCTPDFLGPLSRIRWSHLKTLSFEKIMDPVQVSESMRTLVTTPTLTRLELCDLDGPWELEQLQALFAHLPMGLKALTICHFHPYYGHEYLSTAREGQISSSVVPKIQELELNACSGSAFLLLDSPLLPLDFSELKKVQPIPANSNPELYAFLRRNCANVESMYLDAHASFDLSSFPQLTHLEFDSYSSINTITTHLTQLPASNRISHLTVNTALSEWLTRRSIFDYHKLQDLALQRLPALTTVSIIIDYPTRIKHSRRVETLRRNARVAVQQTMPQLCGRGMLMISFNPVDTEIRGVDGVRRFSAAYFRCLDFHEEEYFDTQRELDKWSSDDDDVDNGPI